MDTTAVAGTSWVRLTKQEADYAWLRLEPFVQKAVELTGGDLTTEDIYNFLVNDAMSAFVVYEGPKVHAVCITQLLVDLHSRICRIIVLSGEDMKHWEHFECAIEAWARAHNCDYIDAFTRPGMARRAMPLGYSHKYSIIRKSVSKELH